MAGMVSPCLNAVDSMRNGVGALSGGGVKADMVSLWQAIKLSVLKRISMLSFFILLVFLPVPLLCLIEKGGG